MVSASPRTLFNAAWSSIVSRRRSKRSVSRTMRSELLLQPSRDGEDEVVSEAVRVFTHDGIEVRVRLGCRLRAMLGRSVHDLEALQARGPRRVPIEALAALCGSDRVGGHCDARGVEDPLFLLVHSRC